MRIRAPAKINWTLEVLGRRHDGYHEIRSVMQTIDVCDVVEVEAGEALRLAVAGPHTARDDDLVLRSARALQAAAGLDSGAAIRLAKDIPAAAGLGGGSSDAAAALRCLNRLWGIGMTRARLSDVAATVSSDAPFFLWGGTALAEGRGERVTPLPDVPRTWLVLLVPPADIPDKTRRMYEALTPADFSDGVGTGALVARVRGGESVSDADISNAFTRAAFEVFEGLAAYRAALLSAGASAVHLAGSGPALFAIAGSEEESLRMLARLRIPAGRAMVARTLAAQAATANG